MTVDEQKREQGEADQAGRNAKWPFSALKAFERYFPARRSSPKTNVPDPLPETTTGRRRASTLEQSLDKDASLPEKVVTHELEVVGDDHARDEEDTAPQTVLYLAYGSNLAAKTFRGTRGIRPLSELKVLVPSLRLTFDLPGIPYTEPCFAGTRSRTPGSEGGWIGETSDDTREDEEEEEEEREKRDGKPLLPNGYRKDRWRKPLVGVVYEVTLSDYARIIATEGGGRGYRDVVVDCFPFPEKYDPSDPVPDTPTTEPFKAHTLLSPATDTPGTTSPASPLHLHLPIDASYAQPSARYLDLIRTGAAEHNLPTSYQAYLAQIRAYRVTTPRQRVGQVLFLALWAPGLMLTLFLSRVLAGPDGISPAWLIRFADVLLAAMWKSYYIAFRPVFGDGLRTIGE